MSGCLAGARAHEFQQRLAYRARRIRVRGFTAGADLQREIGLLRVVAYHVNVGQAEFRAGQLDQRNQPIGAQPGQ